MERLRKEAKTYISPIQKQMFLRAFLISFAAVFTQTLAVLIDNLIICGFYSETEIAASALAGPFFYLLEIPAAGIAAGMSVICARETGAGRIDNVSRLLGQVFFLFLAPLMILTAVFYIGAPQMAVLSGARGATAVLKEEAALYLRGLSLEVLPYVLFCILSPVITLDNGGRLISIASFAGCGADIILDLLSVKMGWGLFGIGLASSVSAWLYFGITLLHFLSRDHVIRLKLQKPDPVQLKEMLSSSMPKAVESMANVLRTSIFIWLASLTGGLSGTCVLSIRGTISYATGIFAGAAAGAVGILTGICCGEKNGEELKGISALALRCCFVISTILIGLMLIISDELCAAVTDTAETESLMKFAMICIMVSIPFTFLVQIRISYLQGVGKISQAKWTGLLSSLILVVLCAIMLSLPFGVYGVFMAFPLSEILVLELIRIVHVRRTKRFIPPADSYLEVDETFFAGPGDVISYPVRSAEDCSLLSEQIMLFCKGHHLPERKGYLAAVCGEELSLHALQQGKAAHPDKMPPDLRVVIDNGDVIVRLRESGPPFNLKNLYDRLEEEIKEPEDISLKILLGAAKDISYYRSYGMNTTIIKV